MYADFSSDRVDGGDVSFQIVFIRRNMIAEVAREASSLVYSLNMHSGTDKKGFY